MAGQFTKITVHVKEMIKFHSPSPKYQFVWLFDIFFRLPLLIHLCFQLGVHQGASAYRYKLQ